MKAPKVPPSPQAQRNKLLRKRVFERDQGICAVCGVYDPKWQHDHCVPIWSGGKDTIENSETLCRRHHGHKTGREAGVRAKTDRLRARAALTRKRMRIA